MLQDLELNVTTLVCRSTESGRTSDDESVRSFVILHGRNEIVERRTDPRVLVGRDYERVTFTFKYGLGNLRVGVDQCYNLETRSQFVFESERVIPGSFVTSKVDVSSSNKHQVELLTISP